MSSGSVISRDNLTVRAIMHHARLQSRRRLSLSEWGFIDSHFPLELLYYTYRN